MDSSEVPNNTVKLPREEYCLSFTEIEQGDLDAVIRRLGQFHGTCLNTHFVYAVECGQVKIVRYLLEKGVTYFDCALFEAAWKHHLELVLLLLDTPIDTYCLGLDGAAVGGHIDIAKMILHTALTKYGLSVDPDSYKKLNDLKIVDFTLAINAAKDYDQPGMVEFLEKLIHHGT